MALRITQEGRGVIQHEDHTLIPSFTDPEKTYRVTEQFCSCPAARFGGRYCKHRVLFGMLQETKDVRFGRSMVERRIVELAHAVYRPVKASESLRDSYELMLETFSERYATNELKRAAVKRHGRAISLTERRVA